MITLSSSSLNYYMFLYNSVEVILICMVLVRLRNEGGLLLIEWLLLHIPELGAPLGLQVSIFVVRNRALDGKLLAAADRIKLLRALIEQVERLAVLPVRNKVSKY